MTQKTSEAGCRIAVLKATSHLDAKASRLLSRVHKHALRVSKTELSKHTSTAPQPASRSPSRPISAIVASIVATVEERSCLRSLNVRSRSDGEVPQAIFMTISGWHST